MKYRFVLIPALLLCVLSSVTQANDVAPGKIVKDTVDQVLFVLQDASLNEEKRKELISNLIKERINFKDMSRRVLATNWKAATEEQQVKFITLFQHVLINTYWIRMNQYSGEHVEYITVTSDREGYASVDTIIVKNNSDIHIPISYRMKRFVDVWFAYDFVVESLSLVQSYRNEYNATIKNYGVDGLLDLMQQEVDSYDA
ncbi:MAG: ABC transporter substrate-binding protein [Proteobacteria bacterium]|nr:ABC transporter substrate-binding protein [Pseudomonadota bacterium]NOG59872.1 ABC transporter substrate-binding protein [Pseudomonadota bacterium]